MQLSTALLQFLTERRQMFILKVRMPNDQYWRAGVKTIGQGAIEGTLNVIRQAEKAGITRIVVTSSISSVVNPQKSFTDQGKYTFSPLLCLLSDIGTCF